MCCVVELWKCELASLHFFLLFSLLLFRAAAIAVLQVAVVVVVAAAAAVAAAAVLSATLMKHLRNGATLISVATEFISSTF